MINLAILCSRYEIQMQVYYIFNESLITRARAYAAAEFLRSECTHMLFIDADIGFDPDYVLSLLALQSDDSEYDVICAPYPKKTTNYYKIRDAVNKGVADEDPNVLKYYTGDFVLNFPNGTHTFDINKPFEVMEAGTGFMMIRRKTFDDFKQAYPELMFKPDHIGTEHFDGSQEICMFFDCVIDPDSKRYLSEDYMFCSYVRKMGGKIWMCGWMNLTHTGTMTYEGKLSHIASIGSSILTEAPKKTAPASRIQIQPMIR